MAQDSVVLSITASCVGMKHRLDSARAFQKGEHGTDASKRLFGLYFEREPNNPANPDAVKVMYRDVRKAKSAKGNPVHHLGYIPNERLEKFRNFLDHWESLEDAEEMIWIEEFRNSGEAGTVVWFAFKIQVTGLDTEE